MTQYADIVLPALMHVFEKWSFNRSKANKHGFASIQQQVIEPLWDVVNDEIGKAPSNHDEFTMITLGDVLGPSYKTRNRRFP